MPPPRHFGCYQAASSVGLFERLDVDAVPVIRSFCDPVRLASSLTVSAKRRIDSLTVDSHAPDLLVFLVERLIRMQHLRELFEQRLVRFLYLIDLVLVVVSLCLVIQWAGLRPRSQFSKSDILFSSSPLIKTIWSLFIRSPPRLQEPRPKSA